MSKANVEAKKERHEKLFEGQYHTWLGRVWFHTKRGLKATWHFLKPSGKKWSEFKHPLDHLPAPKRLYVQLSTWSIGLLVLTSINVSNAASHGGEGVGKEYLALDISTYQVTDDEGYIIKNMPLQGETTFDQNRTETVEYTVQSGDTLSMIAYRYGLNINSIRYANSNLGSSDKLKVGQLLKIPPKDGLYVTIPSGGTLVALMDKYKGNLDKTKEFNNVQEDSQLEAGKQLFIVEGKPEVVYIAQVNSSKGTSYNNSGGYNPNGPSSSSMTLPASAGGWIRPTTGGITQGYHSGHLAYDIAQRSKPPILAVADGTVESVCSGWCGGYGNSLWVNHNNGYKTHYAHMEEYYVQTGDTVTQGQVLGKMGNTGNVRGATGIHLHFEVSYNGTKISPSFMGVW